MLNNDILTVSREGVHGFKHACVTYIVTQYKIYGYFML